MSRERLEEQLASSHSSSSQESVVQVKKPEHRDFDHCAIQPLEDLNKDDAAALAGKLTRKQLPYWG